VAWARVQSKNNNVAASTTLTITFTGTPVTGNKIAVFVTCVNGTTVSTVKDGNLVSLTQGASAVNATNVACYVYFYDVPATPSTTFTVTASGSSNLAGDALELSGLLAGNTTACIDGACGTLSGTTTPAAPTYSSTLAGEFLFTYFGDWGNTATCTVPSGLTLDTNSINTSANANACVGYGNTSGGSDPTSWSYTTTGNQWAAFTGAFKLAAGGGAEPTWRLPTYILLPLVARAQEAWRTGPPAQTDYTVTQTDDAGLTDTTGTYLEHAFTDAAGLTDTSTVQVVKDVTQTDSAGLTDTVEKTISQAQTDSAGLTDTTAAALTKTQTDSAGLTDTAAVELSKLLTQTDDAGLTDSVIRTIAQAVTDTAGLTDTTSLSRSATQTDSTGLTDTSTVVSAKSVDQTDSTGLTDTFALRRDLAPTDSTGLTDSTTIGPFSKTQTDSAGLTDSATTVLGSPFTPAYVSVDASTGSGGLDSAATATTTDADTSGTNLDTATSSGAVDTTTVPSGMVDA
jgi:hypothetical protein